MDKKLNDSTQTLYKSAVTINSWALSKNKKGLLSTDGKDVKIFDEYGHEIFSSSINPELMVNTLSDFGFTIKNGKQKLYITFIAASELPDLLMSAVFYPERDFIDGSSRKEWDDAVSLSGADQYLEIFRQGGATVTNNHQKSYLKIVGAIMLVTAVATIIYAIGSGAFR